MISDIVFSKDEQIVEVVPYLKDARTINWLLSAVSRDEDRLVICGIHVRPDGVSEAVDGYQLHQCPTPACLHEYAGKILVPAKEREVKTGKMFRFVVLPDHYTFPDTSRIIPRMDKVKFEIQIDARRLTNVIHGFTARNYSYVPELKEMSKVRIYFTDTTSPILIEGERNYRAILMPVFSGTTNGQ